MVYTEGWLGYGIFSCCLNGICPECRKKVTYRQKRTECDYCLNWFHQKCGKLLEMEYRSIANTVWFCSAYCQLREKNQYSEGKKLFLRYADDIVRIVIRDPEKTLNEANHSHSNLQITFEKAYEKSILVDNGWTTNSQRLGPIKLFRGTSKDSSNKKPTRALVRTYIRKVLIIQAKHP